MVDVTPAAARSCGGIVTVVGPPGPDDPLSDIGGGAAAGGGAADICGGGWILCGGGGLPLVSHTASTATTSTAPPPAAANNFGSGMLLTGGGTRELPQLGQTKGCFSSTRTVRRRLASAHAAVLGHLPGVFIMASAPGTEGLGNAVVSSAASGDKSTCVVNS